MDRSGISIRISGHTVKMDNPVEQQTLTAFGDYYMTVEWTRSVESPEAMLNYRTGGTHLSLLDPPPF